LLIPFLASQGWSGIQKFWEGGGIKLISNSPIG
jgi:hypothetical protein